MPKLTTKSGSPPQTGATADGVMHIAADNMIDAAATNSAANALALLSTTTSTKPPSLPKLPAPKDKEATTMDLTTPAESTPAEVNTVIPTSQPPDDDEEQNQNIKCDARCCPRFPLIQATATCSFEGCNKSVHFVCYAAMIKKSKDISLFDDTKVFCMIKHQKEYVKSINVGKLNWKNDGGGGKDDDHHSEFWLVMWLGKDDNFHKWREPGQGVTKIELSAGIAEWLFDKGVKVKRSPQQVRCKIEYLEKAMKQAYDWSHSDTGAGLLESHGPTTFRESVLEKCQYYYDLEDKFTSRSGIAPKAFSKDIGDWLVHSDSEECVVADGADEIFDDGADDLSTPTPAKKRKSSEASGKKPLRSKVTSLVSNTNKKRRNKSSGGDNEMEYLLKQAIKQKLKEPREDNVSKTLRLAEQFKAMTLALDSKVKAANACPEFVQFLDPQEKADLIEYNKWVESASVNDSSC